MGIGGWQGESVSDGTNKTKQHTPPDIDKPLNMCVFACLCMLGCMEFWFKREGVHTQCIWERESACANIE